MTTGKESIHLPSGIVVQVAKHTMNFQPWSGTPLSDTYGNKCVMDVTGRPLFAELAILQHFSRDGWAGVWVDSYRRKFRTGMLDVPPVEVPDEPGLIYRNIAAANGSRGGCWDVFMWRGSEVRFIESKRAGKDRMRESQVAWLEAALSVGIPLAAFTIVEWQFSTY